MTAKRSRNRVFGWMTVLALGAASGTAQPPTTPPAPPPPLALSFGPDGATVSGLSPGDSVAWLALDRRVLASASYLEEHARVTADDDGDGAVLLPLAEGIPPQSVWAAVDLASGEPVVAAPSGSRAREIQLPATALQHGAGGRLDRIVKAGRLVHALLVRPEVGSWKLVLGDGGTADDDGQANGSVAFVLSQLEPMTADGPPPPEELAGGDTLVLLDPDDLSYAVVRVSAPGTGQGGS